MKVKKKCISSLKRCFILSLCVVIGLAASLQGFCTSTLSFPLKLDYGVSSSWSLENDYMQGDDRWDKFQPLQSTSAFSCFYTFSDGNTSLFPTLASNTDYTLTIKTAWTIQNTTYNTIDSNTFASQSSLSVAMQNGDNVSVSPSVRFTRWTGGTGFNVYYTYQIPDGASFLYGIEFGCRFSKVVPTSVPMYLTVYPLELSTVSGTDRIVSAIGNDTPNTSTVDDYNKAESELMGGVQGGLNDINSQWNNINGDLLQYQGAFFAFRSFFNKLTDLPFVSVVVTLSVSVGSFALLLGAVNTIFKNRGD